MTKIERIYIISHTHTDLGYTDLQDVVARQQLGFIDQAIERICTRESIFSNRICGPALFPFSDQNIF